MMNTADSWSRVLRHLSLTIRPRDSSASTIPEARIQLLNFLETGQESYLQQARVLLPGCQTSQELEELADVVDCSRDPSAACMSNCGSPALAYLVSTLFFAITSLVMLNLLLAVLMQSLQEHQQRIKSERDEVKSNQGDMQLLMSVSRAAVGWRQAKKMKDDSDDEDAGPINAGVSPMARLPRQPGDIGPSLISSRPPPLSPQHRSEIDQSESPYGRDGSQPASRARSQEAQSRTGDDSPASSPIASKKSPIAAAKRAMQAITGSFKGSKGSFKDSFSRPATQDSDGAMLRGEEKASGSAASPLQSPGSEGQRSVVRTASFASDQPGNLPHPIGLLDRPAP